MGLTTSNQKIFKEFAVSGQTTLTPPSLSSTLNIVPGSSISVTTDPETNSMQINSTGTPSSHIGAGDTAHALVTVSVAGFMSAADKVKLNGIATGANLYVHPNHSGDVTSVGDGATTIAAGVVTNAKLASVATSTIKGRSTAGSGAPEDLTAAQVRTILNVADGANAYVHPNHSGDATSAGDGAITLATVATAGTYRSVTIDAKGRVTSGTNPTTLAGYGITDAAPSSHVGSGGAAHAVATTSAAGFMSAADKTRLDGLSAGSYNDDNARAACVAQTITDGTTTSAPSQNAVFDALALKAPTASPTFTGVVSSAGDVRIAAVSTYGIGFWGSSPANYGIRMSDASAGRISTETTSDYNMYFMMTGGANRGFVFSSFTGINAQIDGAGYVHARTGFRAGKYSVEYNATEDSLNFVYN